jgi:hypothetical protein
MKKIASIFIWTLIFVLPLRAGDSFCGLRNNAFLDGERIDYDIFYSVIGLYVNAGSASFTTNVETLNNKPVYHVTGSGSSNTSYDWIFKVRDQYESYFDTATLQPYKFIRNVNEGGFKIYENVTFNQKTNTAITDKGVFKVPSCIQDVLSSIYYARNIDYNSYKPEVHQLYIKYMGKEKIKTRFGKFNAIKFKPLLVKGTIFEGGEGMTVWVSDDANHIPLRIESPIVVGSIKVDMMEYENIRYPLTSLISRR